MPSPGGSRPAEGNIDGTTECQLRLLDQDGYIDALYPFLWSKNPLTGRTAVHVLLPDTIVYKYSLPACWYFTARDGSIKRRNRKNCIPTEIMEKFCKGSSMGQVVAVYLCRDPEDPCGLHIEYLDTAALDLLLHNPHKAESAVLQKFVPPKSPYYSVVRCVWSPKICLLEKIQNKHRVNDRKVSAAERVVTIEGAPHQVQNSAVKSRMLVCQYNQMCSSIVEHVHHVSGGNVQVSRLVLCCSEAADDTIRLLWCTSVRVVDSSLKGNDCFAPIDLNVGVRGGVTPTRLQTTIDGVEVPYMYDSLSRELLVKCVGCESCTLRELCGTLPMSQILSRFNKEQRLDSDQVAQAQDLSGLAADVEEQAAILASVAPPEVRNMFPQMQINDYVKLVEDPKFIGVEVRLCADCIESYALSSPCGGLPPTPALAYQPSSTRASPFGCQHSMLAATIPFDNSHASSEINSPGGILADTMLLSDLRSTVETPSRRAHNRPLQSPGNRPRWSSRPQSAPGHQLGAASPKPAHTGVKLGVRPAKGLSRVGHTNKPGKTNALWGIPQRSPTKDLRIIKAAPCVEPEPAAMVAAKALGGASDPQKRAHGIVEAALEYHVSLLQMRNANKELVDQGQHLDAPSPSRTRVHQQRAIPRMEGLTAHHTGLIGRALEHQRSLREPEKMPAPTKHPALSFEELQVARESRGNSASSPLQPLGHQGRKFDTAADVMPPSSFSIKQQQQVLMRIQQLTNQT